MNYVKNKKSLSLKFRSIVSSVWIYKVIQIILIGYGFIFLPVIAVATDRAKTDVIGGNEASILEQNLAIKYKIDSIQIKQGPDGPVGLFYITGDLTPSAVVNNMGTVVESDPRTIAHTFLLEQASLFGISNVDEDIRESSMTTDRHGRTHISYHRYVDSLRLDGMEILVHIGTDGKIFAVNGNLVPITPLLSATVSTKAAVGLTKDKIRTIIKDDLSFTGIDPEAVGVMKFEKVAMPSDPYVVWKVDVILGKGVGRWLYTIDAFTGRVLEKRENIQNIQSLHRAAVPAITNDSGKVSPSIAKTLLQGTKKAVPGSGETDTQEKDSPNPSMKAPMQGTKKAVPISQDKSYKPILLTPLTEKDYSKSKQAQEKRKDLSR